MTYPPEAQLFRLDVTINEHWKKGLVFELLDLDGTHATWIRRPDWNDPVMLPLYRILECTALTPMARRMKAALAKVQP